MPSATCSASNLSLVVPATQNTAPVYEFNCLYTHDIRRKSKRWQDGFLRFHTFNKRVMVFDVPRNLIGDTHWRVDEPLQEGDEVTLDRSGVLVQVADQIGKTETDLTGLRKSKNRTVEDFGPPSSPCVPSGGVSHAIQRGAAWSKSGRPATPASDPRQPLQDKHRSLNALLGSNRTPVGRAASIVQSPFEIRRQREKSNADIQEPVPKRRKVNERKSAIIAKEARAVSVEQAKRRSPNQRHDREETPGLRKTATVIELSSDVENQSGSMRKLNKAAASHRTGKHSGNTVRQRDHVTRHLEDEERPRATRLRIKAPSTKRGLLICLPNEQSSARSDSEIQQKRLDARLARLAEHNVYSKGTTKDVEDRKKQANMLNHDKRATSFSKHRNDAADNVVIAEDMKARLDRPPPADNAGFDTDETIQSRQACGEAYDLFGTDNARPASEDEVAQRALEPAPSHALFDLQCDPRTNKPPDTLSEIHQFPSTLEMDQALIAQAKVSHQRDTATEGSIAPLQTGRGMSSGEDSQVEAQSTALDLVKSAGQDECSKASASRNVDARSKQQTQDPWSREAFDLFKWRPPGWDEERWCRPSV